MHGEGSAKEPIEDLDILSTGSALHLRGNLDVSHAADLKRQLLAAFEQTGPIEIDCSEVTDLDLSTIQLLSSAKQKALHSGRRFFASSSLPQKVKERFVLAGLDPFCLQSATRMER